MKKFLIVATCALGLMISGEALAVGCYHKGHFAYITREGDIVYSNGWRYRQGYGWDHSCHNLPWLPSMFACSVNGG